MAKHEESRWRSDVQLSRDGVLILLHDPELALSVTGRLSDLPPVVLDVHEDLAGSLQDDGGYLWKGPHRCRVVHQPPILLLGDGGDRRCRA